jgi:hypothetical protein
LSIEAKRRRLESEEAADQMASQALQLSATNTSEAAGSGPVASETPAAQDGPEDGNAGKPEELSKSIVCRS